LNGNTYQGEWVNGEYEGYGYVLNNLLV
jgi:hypothetical protein